MSITRHALPGPTRAPLAHRERIEWHYHAEHQLIYPKRGVLQVSTDLGAWIVPPHRAVWVPSGVAHSHQASGPTEMRTLAFARSVNPLRVDRPTVLAVTPLLREAITRLSDSPAPSAARRRNLERVVRDELRAVDELPLCLPSLTDPRLRDVAALLTADPGDPRSLAQLGAAVGASERTLSRLFRAEAGMSFPQWRTQLRLHEALRLLAGGTSVTSAAVRCGYHTSSAFIAAFRSTFGTTPARYRADATLT